LAALEDRDHLESLGRDGKRILKCILNKTGLGDMDWVNFAENNYLSIFGVKHFNCLLRNKVAPVFHKLSVT
jgi:hypothetical protein